MKHPHKRGEDFILTDPPYLVGETPPQRGEDHFELSGESDDVGNTPTCMGKTRLGTPYQSLPETLQRAWGRLAAI